MLLSLIVPVLGVEVLSILAIKLNIPKPDLKISRQIKSNDTTLPNRRFDFSKPISDTTRSLNYLKHHPFDLPKTPLQKPLKITYSPNAFIKDLTFQLRLRPNNHFTQTIVDSKGQIVRKVKVTIDSLGRRIVIGPKKVPQNRFLAFIGCSFVFGDGLNDDETLPSIISALRSNVSVVNTALPGWGPGQFLLQIRNQKELSDISLNDGFGIYMLIQDHFMRMINAISVVGVWAPHTIALNFLPNGEIRSLGPFNQAFPTQTKIYNFLAQTAFFRFWKIDYPLISSKVLDQFILVFEEMRHEFKKVTRGKELYIAFHPIGGIDSVIINYLITEFESRKIPYLDYSGMNHWITANIEATLPDQHPSFELNQVLARKIADDFAL